MGLPFADVVVLGEVHDNPTHHKNQAAAVFDMQPRAIVFEMLTPEQAGRDFDRFGDVAAMGQALDWQANGWPDFAMYYPLFIIVPDVQVFGGNVDAAAVRVALDRGAALAFGADAGRYGLDVALTPDDQVVREAEQRDAHCGALPENMLAGMVEVQRLRDAALARAVVEAMASTGGPVVVITGTGHARTDVGVPAVLRFAAPMLQVISVGQVEEPAAGAPFDYWLVTDAPTRGDPCAAFGVPD
jgi:uncharacterized iron-regulated protein